MDYKQLYEQLLADYNLIKEENKLLRKQLNLPNRDYLQGDFRLIDVESVTPSAETVTMHSSPADKVALFRSLFKGREDVYARRWYSEKSGKCGYSPVCVNEWNFSLCDKKNVKCSACDNRQYAALDDKAIEAHLRGLNNLGKDVVGIYPLVEGDFCYFLAMDFDGDDWQDDISTVLSVCKDLDVQASVERSRSGNGGHIWFFFEDKIPASTARKFGSMLLTLAMERRHEIKFSSYDRLFPNQDTVPQGGFGNLISLPLQGQARKLGNSVFVDENFVPYPDQWAYLFAVEKLTEKQIDALLLSSDVQTEPQDDVGDEENKPWNRKQRRDLSADEFPPCVNIVLSNMTYVEKAGVSEFALNKIKRLAAFYNPEYFKAQRMRLPVFNKPCIISTHEETEEYLAIPRGCLDALTKLLHDVNVEIDIADRRNSGNSIKVDFNGELREEQNLAFNALSRYDTGVLSATTAFGKTVIGAGLIAEKKVNTLVLVHTAALLNQWKEALSKFLIVDNLPPVNSIKRGRKKEQSQIGQLGATKNTLNGFIDVAIMQSLFDGEEVKELVKDYGMIIVDECHHVPAVSFEKIMKTAAAKYVYGLTATPQRQDGHQKIIYMQCGDIRYKVEAKQQAAASGFEHLVSPRFTAFRMPLTAGKPNIQKTFELLCQSDTRNETIIRDVITAVNCGRNVLVLTERRMHAEKLESLLNEKGIKTYLLIGAESAKLKREKLNKIAAESKNERFVIVATGKYVGEGFDSARLDTLFLTMPISWKGKLAQYVGRLHRMYEGKKEVIVYDYVDVNVGMLENMYRKRVIAYRSLGYEIKVVDKGQKTGILFDKFDYHTVFYEDVKTARKSVLIVCPQLKSKPVQKFCELLQIMSEKPQVTVYTIVQADNVAEKELIELMKTNGIEVKCKENLNSKFAIIDNRLIWYGSIAYLGYSFNDDTALRFESLDTANELKNILK